MKKKITTKKMIATILLSLLMLIVTQIISQGLASSLYILGVPLFICNALAGILYIGLIYIAAKFLCSKVLKYQTNDFNIMKPKVNIKWIMIGILLPIIVCSVYLLFNGNFVSSGKETSEIFAIITGAIFFTGLGAGIVEEIVFRGFIMNALSMRFNKTIAIIVPSLLFGVAHTIGMDFDFRSCALVLVAGTLVGVMFSLITIETKSIWNSAFVHALWNIVMIGGVLSIGNAVDEYSIYTYVIGSKSFMITGGDFGIESSVISVIAYAIVSLIAFRAIKNKIKTQEELQQS
ncbi:MAG: type II CAAX endopeptidase family protein [Acetivibrio sp.]